MKKPILMMALLAAGSAAVAQNLAQDKVPAAVKDSFRKAYPAVTKVKWEVDEGNYEAEFKKGNEEWEIEFDTSGNLIKSEMELGSVGALPKAIQDALKKDYAAYKIGEPEEVTLANGKKVYEVEGKTGGKKYELQFDKDGVLLNKIEDVESD